MPKTTDIFTVSGCVPHFRAQKPPFSVVLGKNPGGRAGAGGPGEYAGGMPVEPSTPARAAGTAAADTAADAARAHPALVPFATLLLFTLLAGEFWRDLLSWWGWGMLAGILLIASVVLLVHERRRLIWHRMPKMLGLFLLLATVSLAWSFYPGASALGLAAQWATTAAALPLALCLDWPQLLRVLSASLRWIIGLSLAFELFVSVFIRHPVLPFFTDYGDEKVPQAFYWSRNLLFHGGQIQGILGNSNLLAMCVLLALIVFGIQLADRTVRRGSGITWLVLAVLTFGLTRSSTVILATAFTAVVLAFALWARAARPDRRLPIYLTGLVVAAASVTSVIVAWSSIPQIFGKSEDFTGRITIWQAVIEHAVQRPAFGWGWVSYWAPWVEPFTHLAERKGVTYLQAHNAWLDVWLQLGIIGLVIFALLVATTLLRSWFFAVDRPRVGLMNDQPFTAVSLLPLLILAALLAQSVAESRILVEAGWVLLVVFSVKTKMARP